VNELSSAEFVHRHPMSVPTQNSVLVRVSLTDGCHHRALSSRDSSAISLAFWPSRKLSVSFIINYQPLSHGVD